MSNETDLDWLARNVHVWPAGDHQPWCYVYMVAGGAMKASGNFLDAVAYPIMITKDQWLARRAELQNKPGWDDAPEWGEWLAQDDRGEWYWYAAKPTHPGMKSWWPAPGAMNAQCGKGEVLGDWRDTLEKRPEEFKQLTSIEDNQEQVMTQQKDMKQDNKWFERGELPPVGVECEYVSPMSGEVKAAFIVAKHHFSEQVIWSTRQSGGELFYGQKGCFRPIRTERDVLLSVIVEEMNRYDTDGKLADAILAAGFSLRDK